MDLQRVARGQTECKEGTTNQCLKLLEDIQDKVAQELSNERRLEWEDLETMDKLAKEVGITCFAIKAKR